MADGTARHVRINHGFLAQLERRVLIWTAQRLPGWIHSDHLTGLAVAGMALASLSFALSRWFPMALVGVVAGLAINWFGDSLDGTVARVRKQERPRYGYYVDHVLDVVGATMLMGGLALSHYMTPLLALAVLVAYLLVSAEVFLSTAVGGDFRMSFLRIGPTELRILVAGGALALLRWPGVSVPGLGTVLVFDVAGGLAVVGLLLALAMSAVTMGRHLYASEPRHAAGHGPA